MPEENGDGWVGPFEELFNRPEPVNPSNIQAVNIGISIKH